MKKITFLFLFLISFASFGQVIIGASNNGTAFNSSPITPYYGYSYSQTIYLASEINANGNITSLNYQLNPGTSITSCDDTIDVWIGHTTKSNFLSDSDWVAVNTLTQVLTSGTITAAGDVVTITFSAPFAYNGTDNLIIAVDANEAGFGGTTDYFLQTTGPANTSLYHRADSINADPVTGTPTGTLASIRGNVTMNGIIQACPNPTVLTATGITETSANVGWTSAASAWNIEWGTTSFVQGTGAMVSGTINNPHSLNSLSPATAYDFYVQAECGGDSSGWVGPFSFTTLCGAITPSFTQDFANYPGACWTEGNNTDVATGPNGTNGVWVADGFLNNTLTGAARVNIFGGGAAADSDWLVTPTFDFSAGGYGIAYDTGVTTFSGTTAATIGSDDSVLFLISEDDGVSWTTLETFNTGNTPSNSGETKVYNLTTYTSATTKFAFLMTEGATSGGDINFYVDNFKVDLHSILGIEELKQFEGFVMYPNPVIDELTVSAKSEIKSLSIVSMFGQTVRTVTPNSRDYKLDFSDLTSGIYFVKASVNNTESTFRIVKK